MLGSYREDINMANKRVQKQHIAIIGTGMAGLVTAFLLQNDPLRRYDCTVFEQGSEPALDAASLSITDPRTGKMDRLDLPMRAFAGGYYRNLRAMYDFLKIPYHAQRFNFSFTHAPAHSSDGSKPMSTSYFVHTSNLHQLPPPKPADTSPLLWIFEIVYVLVCYAYFTVCCFYILPRTVASGVPHPECLNDYFSRIHLPRHFVDAYLAPLLASVCTCTHEELLQFPASDIVGYKKETNGAHHYVVSNGVQSVQQRLIGSLNVRFNHQVRAIEPHGGKVRVVHSVDASSDHTQDTEETQTDEFDRVILAVPPNVAGQIYPRLQSMLSRIPTRIVESSVHDSPAEILSDSEVQVERVLSSTPNVQSIHLRTSTSSDGTTTEALHVQPSGHIVATRTLPNDTAALKFPSSHPQPPVKTDGRKTTFYRVLRTTESQAILQDIFAPSPSSEETTTTNLAPQSSGSDEKQWRNGDKGIYLVGGWAWDGMVLLEGCIVSAMRVAKSLRVVVPWEYS